VGVFFDARGITDVDAVRDTISESLQRPPPPVGDLQVETTTRVNKLLVPGDTFKGLNLLIAVGILAVFVAAAVITDATGVDDSSKALFGLSTTILGVIVGLLGGERSRS
jgi:hypothetical protein